MKFIRPYYMLVLIILFSSFDNLSSIKMKYSGIDTESHIIPSRDLSLKNDIDFLNNTIKTQDNLKGSTEKKIYTQSQNITMYERGRLDSEESNNKTLEDFILPKESKEGLKQKESIVLPGGQQNSNYGFNNYTMVTQY